MAKEREEQKEGGTWERKGGKKKGKSQERREGGTQGKGRKKRWKKENQGEESGREGDKGKKERKMISRKRSIPLTLNKIAMLK